ncbi:hypothetical protein BVRB_1g023380 isoform B [Beta vulgaris subsp. vulgaris]|uniref:Uncharacterized protein n=1 Tax=Beta vulgaris subsp. vulgaris TaxID=3555 RepID=A0A0J8BDU9_BETVV|nr:hypothetical protein BVRB_1g023380 isoform B [Beta vulgaris subsp. vulgaris]
MVPVLSLTGGALYTTSVPTNMNADVPTLARRYTRNRLYAFYQVSFLLLVLRSIRYCSILLLFFIGRSNFLSFLLFHLVGLDITFAPSPIVELKSQLIYNGDPDLVNIHYLDDGDGCSCIPFSDSRRKAAISGNSKSAVRSNHPPSSSSQISYWLLFIAFIYLLWILSSLIDIYSKFLPRSPRRKLILDLYYVMYLSLWFSTDYAICWLPVVLSCMLLLLSYLFTMVFSQFTWIVAFLSGRILPTPIMQPTWNFCFFKKTLLSPINCHNILIKMTIVTWFYRLFLLEINYCFHPTFCWNDFPLLCLISISFVGIVLMRVMYIWCNIATIPYIVISFSHYLLCAKTFKLFLWWFDTPTWLPYIDSLEFRDHCGVLWNPWSTMNINVNNYTPCSHNTFSDIIEVLLPMGLSSISSNSRLYYYFGYVLMTLFGDRVFETQWIRVPRHSLWSRVVILPPHRLFEFYRKIIFPRIHLLKVGAVCSLLDSGFTQHLDHCVFDKSKHSPDFIRLFPKLLSKLDWALKTHWTRVLYHSLLNFYVLRYARFIVFLFLYGSLLSNLVWVPKTHWTRVLHHSLLSSLSHWIPSFELPFMPTKCHIQVHHLHNTNKTVSPQQWLQQGFYNNGSHKTLRQWLQQEFKTVASTIFFASISPTNFYRLTGFFSLFTLEEKQEKYYVDVA